MVSAILLAAGESKRMGELDKLLLEYKGRRMINHMLQSLCSSNVSEVIVVRQQQEEDLIESQYADRIKVAINPDFRKGMTTSIQAGVKEASQDASGYMICLSDQPLMTPRDYNKVIERFELLARHDAECIVVPFHEGKKGNPVIFSSCHKETILAHDEMHGCNQIVQSNKSHLYPIHMNHNHVLIDVDTPEDYEKIKS